MKDYFKVILWVIIGVSACTALAGFRTTDYIEPPAPREELGMYCSNSLVADCSGVLGDNLIPNDFGKGTLEILPTLPNLGFLTEQKFSPVLNELDHGSFSIASTTASVVDDNLSFWAPIQDSSDDPTGYMMIVNSWYSAKTVYEVSVGDLCENTVYQFSVDIVSLARSIHSWAEASHVEFFINNEMVYSSGSVPKDETWHAYKFNYLTGIGEQKLTFTIKNGTPGGQHGDFALDNVGMFQCYPIIDLVINGDEDLLLCAGDNIELVADLDVNGYIGIPFFHWQYLDNGVWTSIPGANDPTLSVGEANSDNVGQYRCILTNSPNNINNDACWEAVAEIEVALRSNNGDTIIPVTICEGETYTFDGEILDQAGTYQDTLINVEGCDSIIVLNLAIAKAEITNLNQTICEGETFEIGGTNYTETGYFTYMTTSQFGCDSTVNLDLIVNPNSYTTLNETICEGEIYKLGAATYDATGTYMATFPAANRCDSIVTLNLTVLAPITIALDETICAGETYTVGSTTYNTTGNYMQTLTSSMGCDSIVGLSLTVLEENITMLEESICDGDTFVMGGNNYTTAGSYTSVITDSNDCDSTIVLNLSVRPNAFTSFEASICAGETYDFGGNAYDAAGNYDLVLTAANGCDSTSTLILSVLNVPTTNLTENICDGDIYTIGNDNYTTSGDYTTILTAANGCDSIVNLSLTVSPIYNTSIKEIICAGTSYTLGDQTYGETGSYEYTFASQSGCDSLVELSLTVLDENIITLNEIICEGDSFEMGGTDYTTAGTFNYTTLAANGCDSTTILNLSVLPNAFTSFEASICDGETYDFGGNAYDTAGNYDLVLTAANGCDSTSTLILSVLDVPTTNLTESICDGDIYTVGNEDYTTSGDYTTILTAANGCDSIVNLSLTVLSVYNTSIKETICAGTSYTLGDQTYSETGSYEYTFVAQNACDSLVELSLTVLDENIITLNEIICEGDSFEMGGTDYTTAGTFNYTTLAANGCDSTTILNLTVLPNAFTSFEASICDGETYDFGGNAYDTAGSYDLVLTAANGCDSTSTLILSVLDVPTTNLTESICDGDIYTVGNEDYTTSGDYTTILTATNGCDSIVNLSLTVLSVYNTSIKETICAGTAYTLGDQTYSETGNYEYTFIAQNACDSLVELSLTVLDENIITLNETICEGDSFEMGGTDYTTAGTFNYTTLAANDCDSTTILNLSVLPNAFTSFEASICDGETYDFGGNAYDTAGSYDLVLTAANGCDSTSTLVLSVLPTSTTNLIESICDGETYTIGDDIYTSNGNHTTILTAANGCDSIVNLALTVFPMYNSAIKETICAGATYTLGDQTYSETGNYEYTFASQNGCDSLVELSLTVLDENIITLNEAICEGDSFEMGGTNYTTAGTYNYTTLAANGCDSTTILNLSILPNIFTSFEASICEGDAYSFGGNAYDTAGNYDLVLTAANGCDSTSTLILSVLPTSTTNLDESICEGETYTIGNQDYTTSGDYIAILTAANGCDSTVNLSLTVLPTYSNAFEVSICANESYTFGDETLTTTGIYQHIFAAQNGCDSTVQILLEVLDENLVTLNEAVCEGNGYQMGGTVYTEAGTYTYTTSDVNNCDSTTILNLEVLPRVKYTFEDSICQGETYEFNGNTYTQAGLYNHVTTGSNGCDSTTTLNLTILPNISLLLNATICDGDTYTIGDIDYDMTGTYTQVFDAANGCDSIVTLNLTVLGKLTTFLSEKICEGGYYYLGDTPYYESGSYQETFTSATGCDSTVNLTLELLESTTTKLQEEICYGETYNVGKDTYTTSGTYENVLESMDNCDSLVILELTVIPEIRSELARSICPGSSYEFDGQNYNEEGAYMAIFESQNGCDSVVLLSLTIADLGDTTIFKQICNGDTYTIGNESFDQTGSYTVQISDYMGCDSTVNLNLQVTTAIEESFDVNICEGETYDWEGTTYTQAGAYQNTYTSWLGCDSIATLNLAILENYSTDLEAAICDGESYTIGTETFEAAGTHEVLLTAQNGCDSLVALTLNILAPSSSTNSIDLCEGDAYDGYTIYNDTTLINYTTNALGCDSTIYTNIAITYTTSNQTTNQVSVCQGDLYNGIAIDNDTTFTQTLSGTIGCDSIVYTEITALMPSSSTNALQLCSGDLYQNNPIYNDTTIVQITSNEAGCDSTIYANISILESLETAIEIPLCEGEAYEGVVYTTDTTLEDTFQSDSGCDSIVYTNITLYPTYEFTDTVYIKEGESYMDMLIEEDILISETETASTGCDSILNTLIIVLPPVQALNNVWICEGDIYEGVIYQNDTILTETLTTSNGADSIIYTFINTYDSYDEIIVDANICDGQSYWAGGEWQTAAGTYEDTYQTQNGCDSIVITQLTVGNNIETNSALEICNGESILIHGIAQSDAGIYTQQYTTSTGCDSTSNVTLYLNNSYQDIVNIELCEGDTYNDVAYYQDASFAINYETSTGCDSIITTNIKVRFPDNITLDIATCDLNQVNTVTATYQNQYGCDSIVTTNMFFQAIEPTYVDIALCEGETYEGVAYYENTTLTNQVVNAEGCEEITYTTIAVNELPQVNLGVIEQFCATDSLTFNLGNIETLIWSDSDTIATGVISQGGIYYIQATAPNGCSIIDTIVVPEPTSITANIDISNPPCPEEDEMIIAIDEVEGGEGPYLYGLNDSGFQGDSIFTDLSSGYYQIHVQDINGCEFSQIIVVEEPPSSSMVDVDLGDDEIIALGDSTQLDPSISNPNIIDNIVWTSTDSTSISCDTCPNPFISPTEQTVYTVTVTTIDGCVSTDEIIFRVDQDREVFIPNAFSPNGDGTNDILQVFVGDDVEIINNLNVFDRWGNHLYSLEDYDPHSGTPQGWDGTFRGKMMNPNVYVYYVEIKFINGDVEIFKGDVTLMR